jgi:Raf kinase inhibitor-like YbhB/YbcL family protein
MHTHTLPAEGTAVASYKVLRVSSPAFKDNGPIPTKYTCNGKNINPPLDIEDLPKQSRCIAVVVEESNAMNDLWVHWLIWNIPVMHHIKEHLKIGVQGINSYGRHCYDGPCLPGRKHRYVFKVYALDSTLELSANSEKPDLERAMSEHILAFGELTAIYKRRLNPFYWLL